MINVTKYKEHSGYHEILYCINTLLCPIKVNSHTIEPIMHTSCYCNSDLLCVTYSLCLFFGGTIFCQVLNFWIRGLTLVFHIGSFSNNLGPYSKPFCQYLIKISKEISQTLYHQNIWLVNQGCWKKVGSYAELRGTMVRAWRVSIYRQSLVKNHLVKTLQVITPFIFFTLFTYITHINPG